MNDDKRGWWARLCERVRDDTHLSRHGPVGRWVMDPVGSLLGWSSADWMRLWTRLLVLLAVSLPGYWAARMDAPQWVRGPLDVLTVVVLGWLLWRWLRAWWRSRGKWQA